MNRFLVALIATTAAVISVSELSVAFPTLAQTVALEVVTPECQDGWHAPLTCEVAGN